ncbi:uncharacterized protein HMPREF1541_05133 [Cyphellophora europaea CBS 101466]|uniref:Uncharacterized protein n=1 Tax=Cyphellophora europaea (strain CBS 101466) TaxID=1220924 RepID=W2RYI5_CYPE1|nr:uncharacterized protein HMPREF1541_05133 [Cyphellophora europaea CBS 101466]ETN40853.1 hypothetical protein HMPREF1541_05133 [Cyphellophora europaea CBS 101466]
MLFKRTQAGRPTSTDVADGSSLQAQSVPGQPLTCMFYFFASQMTQNIQAAEADLGRRGEQQDVPTHRLDTLLARLRMHATFSQLITKFESYPVQITDSNEQRKPMSTRRRAPVHDTVVLMRFRDRRAREEWITTKEWQDFMRQTEAEQVFRQMPHVRCARSLKGLMDPIDVLTA